MEMRKGAQPYPKGHQKTFIPGTEHLNSKVNLSDILMFCLSKFQSQSS